MTKPEWRIRSEPPRRDDAKKIRILAPRRMGRSFRLRCYDPPSYAAKPADAGACYVTRKEEYLEGDDELAMLVATLVKAAQTLLKNQRGEFLPFAAFVNAVGQVEMLGAHTGVAQPKSTEVIEFLRGALGAMASEGRIKSSGICVNVGARLPGYAGQVDAICCFIERVSQPPIDFYVPFRKGILGYNYDKPVALPGTSKVFLPGDSTIL